jgi:uncharacterized membrane protein YagU involved in acid resistance
MSAVMLAARKWGPTPKLPPRKIVEKGMGNPGSQPGNASLNAAATLAHFGFGAAAGAAFALMRRGHAAAPVAQGIGYGLLVWALSYKGWIPALGIMPPPERDDPRRAATMWVAHVVYGALLGGLLGPRTKKPS